MAEMKPVPIDHPALDGIVESLAPGSAAVQVRIFRDLPPNNCYYNVARHVREEGGEQVQGWMLVLWSGEFVQAVHHTVWKNPHGELLDVTLHGFSQRPERYVFVPGLRPDVDLLRPRTPHSRYFVFQDPWRRELVQFVEAERAFLDRAQDLTDFYIACGYEMQWSHAQAEGKPCPPIALAPRPGDEELFLKVRLSSFIAQANYGTALQRLNAALDRP